MSKKKILVLTLAITVFACLFAMDQIGINHFSKITASKEIQEECKRLSKETGTIQVPMTGHVLKSQFSIPSTVECDSSKGDCSKYHNRGITAIMKSVNSNSQKEFIVYTKKEPPEILKSKQPYFIKGKSYEFCVRTPSYLLWGGNNSIFFWSKKNTKYTIEYTESIKQKKEGVSSTDLKKISPSFK